MIDALVRIVDRLVNLAERRHASRRVVFDEIVKPVFTDLETVVEDYLRLFHTTRRRVQAAPRADLPAALEETQKLRQALSSKRVRLQAASEVALADVKDKRLRRFFERVLKVLLSANPSGSPRRAMSKSTELVHFWEYLEQDGMDKGRLVRFIDRSIADLRESWELVGQSYAELHFRALAEELAKASY